jgi:hypothetical protein
MPRYRRTTEGAASLVGRLLLLVAAGKETSATLAAKLGVSARQVNRYVLQLAGAGWRIERRGVPTRGDYWFELVSPRLVTGQRPPEKG